MNIGIVGNEAAKFTPLTRRLAESHIQNIICEAAGMVWGESYRPKVEAVTVISGECHLGGVDIWARDIALSIGANYLGFPPKYKSWDAGYKPRNIKIAENSEKVYVIVVRDLPSEYTGLKFSDCYHCARRNKPSEKAIGSTVAHIKSGACWTAWYAVEKLGKVAEWIVI